MHFFTLVFIPFTEKPTREMVEALLDPAEGKTFPSRKVYLTSQARAVMAGVYAVDPGNVEGVAAALTANEVGGMDEKGLYSLDSRNPQDHWDTSWCIGGRWNGVVQGHSRTEGDSLDDATDAPLQYNICHVNELPFSLLPYAVVTPDGLWYDRGVEDKQREQEWVDEFRALCEKYADCLAVGIDCQG